VEDPVCPNITLKNGLGVQLFCKFKRGNSPLNDTQIIIWARKGKLIADATDIKIFLK